MQALLLHIVFYGVLKVFCVVAKRSHAFSGVCGFVLHTLFYFYEGFIMYNNIGGKIKALARAGFLIGAIAAMALGYLFITASERTVVPDLIVALGGTFIAWVSSWVLYGFGELIEKTSEIAQNTRSSARRY